MHLTSNLLIDDTLHILACKMAVEIVVPCIYVWIFITKSWKLRTWRYCPGEIGVVA